MRITINYGKTMQENAAQYFEKSKKAKKKLAGLEKALFSMQERVRGAQEKSEQAKEQGQFKRKREKKWFEKFHWFYSSDGFLVVAGRDAKGNEVLVKKHMEKDDQYFHAEIYGAPHTIIKTEGKAPPQSTLSEAAQFAAVFSRAWKQKLSAVDVYSVKPEQVSKSAPSGESIGTGAFMIYGKRDWFYKVPLQFALGVDENAKVISGPKSAVLAHAKAVVEVIQGDETSGSTAKKIKKSLEHKTGQKLDLDEIISMLPSGGAKIKESR